MRFYGFSYNLKWIFSTADIYNSYITNWIADTWDQLKTSKITTNLLTHMELGKDFSLNCTVPQIYQSRGCFVNWFTPKPVKNFCLWPFIAQSKFFIFHINFLFIEQKIQDKTFPWNHIWNFSDCYLGINNYKRDSGRCWRIWMLCLRVSGGKIWKN